MGEVVPRSITREGLAYALKVDQTVVDEIFGVDQGAVESDEVTWNDLGLVRAQSLFERRSFVTGSGKSQAVVSALLVDLPPRLLAELNEGEVVAIQDKLADYAVYVATQTIQERGKS